MAENYAGVFGFDLGDGESAVAWADEASQTPPMMLEIAGRKSVLTALGRLDGTAYIGEQAYLSDADDLHVRFKSRFLTDPEYAEPILRAFAEAVLAQLRCGGKLNDPAACAFLVGCPSGWKDDARARYKRIFQQAGFPNVDVISESRAAFMFVRESGELRVDPDALNKPTLIIDAGSSTTDFTFVNRLRAQRAFDFGETMLGGGLIDRMLLDRNVERAPRRDAIRRIFQECPQYLARCELEARKVKEMYFTRHAQNLSRFDVPCESSVKIYYERPAITLDIACSDWDMREILDRPIDALDGKSYIGAYRARLIQAKDALKDAKPAILLLTGGASRMDFMQSVAREVFPDASILHGAEPEFSIARGLCYAMRIEMKTRRFDAEVDALIASDAIEGLLMHAMPDLFRAVAARIADAVVDGIAPDAFALWRSGALKTLDDMRSAVGRMLGESLSGGQLRDALADATRQWLDGLRPELERMTDPICEAYKLPLTTMRFKTRLDVDAGSLGIDMAPLVDINVLQTVVDVIVASLVATLLGGTGTAFLMAGPAGLVVSFAIGFVASRLGTTLAKKHINQYDMPPFMRMLFTKGAFASRLDRKRAQFVEEIDGQLHELLTSPNASVETLIHNVSDAIEGQLKALSEEARLIIH